MRISRESGFTIVELLIVIVVIGILAALVLTSFSQVKKRAQVVAIADGLEKVNKSMKSWAISEGYSTWPIQPIASGGTPLVQLIVDQPGLHDYLQDVPQVDGLGLQDWFYDNDGDVKPECGSSYNGVNIVIRFLPDASVGQEVDSILDDGNVNCGKVRYADQRIFYSLSYGQLVN
jgi:prepilin-type N-terminal cleavage/methylation domain-containing protein